MAAIKPRPAEMMSDLRQRIMNNIPQSEILKTYLQGCEAASHNVSSTYRDASKDKETIGTLLFTSA